MFTFLTFLKAAVSIISVVVSVMTAFHAAMLQYFPEMRLA